MAIGEFFDPQALATAVTPNVDELKTRWATYLNDPTTQAAMLSTAGQLAQPMQWGQSSFGHLMSAIGQGGESVRKSEELQRKEQELALKEGEAESKAGLREAQATAAEARAAAAGERASSADTRLQLQNMRMEGQRLQDRTRMLMGAQREYLRYREKVEERNNDPLRPRGQTPERALSWEEWLSQNPGYAGGLSGGSPSPSAPGGAGSTPVPPPASGSPPAPSSTPAPLAAGQQPPPAAQRPNGLVWDSPRGRVRWDASAQRWMPVGAQ